MHDARCITLVDLIFVRTVNILLLQQQAVAIGYGCKFDTVVRGVVPGVAIVVGVGVIIGVAGVADFFFFLVLV